MRTIGATTRIMKWLIVIPKENGFFSEYFSSCSEIKKKYPFMYPNLLRLKKEQTLAKRKQLRKSKSLPYDDMKVYKLKKGEEPKYNFPIP